VTDSAHPTLEGAPERAARLFLRVRPGAVAGATEGAAGELAIVACGAPSAGALGLGLEAGTLGGSPELAARLAEVVRGERLRRVEVDLPAPAPRAGEGSAGDARDALALAAAAAGLLAEGLVGEVAFRASASGAPVRCGRYADAARALAAARGGACDPRATAVISTWNKLEDVRANLRGIYAQTWPFDDVVVVDNASSDGTADALRAEFPAVRLVVMPNSSYGACETFNIGFACARTELVAILDDDVVLPPHWLERARARLLEEPRTTAVLSTQIIEPGMPESYRASSAFNRERYMSTFRGCASLARTAALREAGGYDERLFLYGNERDLTCRLLNLGYRVLQYPGVEAFHKTPFGIKLGKRSLYYHARNAWLAQLKYAPLPDLVRMPFLVLSRVLLRGRAAEESGEVSDATGTIGIARAVRETPGAWWVLVKAAASVLWNVPYCLRRRAPCRSSDYELPLD